MPTGPKCYETNFLVALQKGLRNGAVTRQRYAVVATRSVNFAILCSSQKIKNAFISVIWFVFLASLILENGSGKKVECPCRNLDLALPKSEGIRVPPEFE